MTCVLEKTPEQEFTLTYDQFRHITLANIENDEYVFGTLPERLTTWACGLRPNCHVPLLKYDMWFTICVPSCLSHGRKTSLYEVTLFAMFCRTPVNNGSMSPSCNGSSK